MGGATEGSAPAGRAEGHSGWAWVGGRKYVRDIIVHVDGSVTDRPAELSPDYRGEYFTLPFRSGSWASWRRSAQRRSSSAPATRP